MSPYLEHLKTSICAGCGTSLQDASFFVGDYYFGGRRELIRKCDECSYETQHPLFKDVDPETFIPKRGGL